MPKKELPCCSAIVEHHTYTTIQRVAFHREADCSRKGRTAMHHDDAPGKTFHFCATHARMAGEGFIDAEGKVMNGNSRRDYQRYNIGTPSDAKRWHEGEAPPAPELSTKQYKMLLRSAKNGRHSGRDTFVPSDAQMNDAEALKAMGLAYLYEDRNGKMRFGANDAGRFLAFTIESTRPLTKRAQEALDNLNYRNKRGWHLFYDGSAAHDELLRRGFAEHFRLNYVQHLRLTEKAKAEAA